jgi:hypothetical protein
MAKVIKSGSTPFVKGGGGKMVGKTGTGTAKPGQFPGKSGSTGKFPGGGSGHMVGKTGAGPAKKR